MLIPGVCHDCERMKAEIAALGRVLAPDDPAIEQAAEAVHDAYLDTCERLGWTVRDENKVSYSALTESSKELDRASVRATLTAIRRAIREALAGPGEGT